VFIYLAYAQPTNVWIVQVCIVLEQFGYGFGFTAFLLYMIHIARGEHQTAHYAICTGSWPWDDVPRHVERLAAGPHSATKQFFVWVILATIPSFLRDHAHPARGRLREARAGQGGIAAPRPKGAPERLARVSGYSAFTWPHADRRVAVTAGHPGMLP